MPLVYAMFTCYGGTNERRSMETVEKHSKELLQALKKKKGPPRDGVYQPIITKDRVHMERLTQKYAKRLQRICGGTTTPKKRGIGGFIWKVESRRGVDRVLSILIATPEGREYFEKNCPDAGSKRWRAYNLAAK